MQPSRSLLPLSPFFAVPTVILLLACGGGGGAPVTSASAPVPVPAWQAPVDLAATGYVNGANLAGDGKGGVVAVWIRSSADAGGTIHWEQMATRLRSDGNWDTPQSLESSNFATAMQNPVAALDDRGRGMIAWFSAIPRSTTTALRTVPVDLAATSTFGARTSPHALDLVGLSDLSLAVGSDGSALAAWSFLRSIEVNGAGTPNTSTVQASRLAPGSGWGTPASYHLNQFSHQGIQGVTGDRRGTYVMEFATGDDAWWENEVADFALNTVTGTAVTGWMPASQVGLPAGHQSAWAADPQGNLETWLLYPFAQEGVADRQAWPRLRSATGTWTVGGRVDLPLSTNSLAVFREAGGTGWLAGLGTQGLWVAPLTGVTPGSPRTLLPSTTTTEALVATRDAAGRPALLWAQRGAGGIDEGIGCSRWDGSVWTTPAILPGTAGASIQRLFAVAGPSGLLAGWVENTATGTRFRTALWK